MFLLLTYYIHYGLSIQQGQYKQHDYTHNVYYFNTNHKYNPLFFIKTINVGDIVSKREAV